MFIQTEATPNPATLKFIPGEPVMADGTANFTNGEDAARSPLATRLFAVDGVEGVFFGHDFITVTKGEESDWQTLKPAVLGAVMEHYLSGDSVILDSDGTTAADQSSEDDDEIVSQIKELLDTRVRPAVAQDGGDIIFHGFEGGVVMLEMHGACAGCPSSTATLKHGIENLLRHYIPEVEEVRSVF